MMNFLRVLTVGAAAFTLMADEPARPGDAKAVPPSSHVTATDKINKQPITPFNKATTVVGMSVKDSSGKVLGKVHDLVFNLETQRFGYALLSLDSAEGARLVPVPVTALKPAEGHFVLNLSQTVLAAASGVANDEWPAVDVFAVGGPATSEKGAASSPDKK